MGTRIALKPFTIPHFERWISENEMTLEDGAEWVAEPFQLEIVADIFEGFREVWAIIPEGNAKTTLFAGVALYLADHSPSPWIPIGAASRDQAEILFGQAAGFVYRSPSLEKHFLVQEGNRKIKCHTGGRGIKVYAGDKDTGDGVIPFPIALVDEPHRHRDMSLYRLWKGKLQKRGAQIGTMSTAGEPDSEFENMREAIRNQATDRTYDGCHLRATGKNLVYHEFMVRKIEDAEDMEVVKGANPLSTITTEYLKEKRESLTLDFGTDWLRLTCNIPTRSSMAAVPERDWDACETKERIPEGIPIVCGADFAWLQDTTAITPLWMRDTEFRLFGDAIVLEPPRDGTMLDVNEVKLAFQELNERNPIEAVVMDMSKAQDLAQWLSSELGCVVIAREQTNACAADDYDAFMEAVAKRWIRHSGDPVFRKHVLSAVSARLLGDRHRFDRPRTLRKAGKNERRIVIDALTAASMVHSYAAARPGEPAFAFV